MHCGMHDGELVPVPIWRRLRHHWWSPGHAWFLEGIFSWYSRRISQNLMMHQVFGQADPASPIGYNIDHTRQQLISSLMILGAFVSSSGAGPIARFIGRKPSIWIAALLCVVSNIIMMTTTSIGALYFARFLIGIANGMLMTFSQLYLQECAPAKYRGLVIGLFQSWTSIGTLVGTIVDNFTVKLDGRDQYIVSLGIVYIVPGILSLALVFLPESPRWFLLQGQTEKARKALHWLRPYPDTVDAEVAMITEAISAEKSLAQSAAVLDMFRNPVDRRRTLLAVGAVSLQAASGAMYMICTFPRILSCIPFS